MRKEVACRMLPASKNLELYLGEDHDNVVCLGDVKEPTVTDEARAKEVSV